ncbi:MAG: polymer-forming cytoskeletal protein [Myxococcota bacterium]
MAGTVLGTTIMVDGEISGEDPVVVQGTVKGRVELGAPLVVAEGGVVEADVTTVSVEIAGSVTGNIQARERVEVRTDGRVVGDIKAPRILIADGAVFKGNVDVEG